MPKAIASTAIISGDRCLGGFGPYKLNQFVPYIDQIKTHIPTTILPVITLTLYLFNGTQVPIKTNIDTIEI